jgi:hypothetical protein
VSAPCDPVACDESAELDGILVPAIGIAAVLEDGGEGGSKVVCQELLAVSKIYNVESAGPDAPYPIETDQHG